MDKNELIIKPKYLNTLRGVEESQVIKIRMKKTTLHQIQLIAMDTEHSRNALIHRFIDYALNHYEIQTVGSSKDR